MESAEYLNLVSEQRAAATEAIKVVQEFLVNPNSLDQQTRTEFLRALALVQSSAEAAAALVPPPELVSLHHRHVDALVTLATVGDLYLAGMDTHDPTQYERASNGLVRGSELLAAVGNEIECLPLPNGTHNTLDNTFQRLIVDLGVRADRFEHLGQSYAKLTQAKGVRLRHVDGARGGTDDARLLPPFFPGIRAVCRNVGKG